MFKLRTNPQSAVLTAIRREQEQSVRRVNLILLYGASGLLALYVVLDLVLQQAGWGGGAVAVAFYVIPEAATVWVLDRLARFDYPGGYGALRYIEDDPAGTMRAIGTAVDPNVLGGMMILVAGLLAPQLFTRQTIFPRWLTLLMLATATAALYLTYSRSALLGLIVSIGLLAVLKYRKLIPLGIVAVLLLFLLPQTQAYVARLLEGFAGKDLATQMRFG